MGKIQDRSECFCSFNEKDANCYNAQEGFCPQVDECKKAKEISKTLFGEKQPGVSLDYSDLTNEQKQQIEDIIYGKAAMPSAKRTRPGTNAPAPGADLSALEEQLNNELGGKVQSAAPVVPPPIIQKGKRGRRSKAEIAAANANVPAEQLELPIADKPVQEVLKESKVILPPNNAPVFSDLSVNTSKVGFDAMTLTLNKELAEKLINSFVGFVNRLQPVETVVSEPDEKPKRAIKRREPKSKTKKGKK